MRKTCKIVLTLLIVLSTCDILLSQNLATDKYEVVLSAIKGSASRPDTLLLTSEKGKVGISSLQIKSDKDNFFRILSNKPQQVTAGKTEAVVIVFEPSEHFIGRAGAVLEIESRNQKLPIRLTGLSTKGLEGENEAPLADIVDALGYKIDVGWTTLANQLRPELQGEELAPTLFKKAGAGSVEMIPVARYSPDFPLNFGYYTQAKTGPVQHQLGILSKANDFPEHQILFPTVAVGRTSFDPGVDKFGFYAISPGHSLYSEDIWNILFHPENAAHAMRIYPVRTKQDVLLNNTYLVCMEEAANGDYNDYVFLVKNVEPVFNEKEYTSLFNGEDLTGWYSWLETKGKNNDPENIFTVKSDGILRDLGKELGYIMTERSFGNYVFELEFKWGEKKWPPRDTMKRDSGICYNIPEDEKDGIWPKSVECQIQEGDVGDFWLLGYSTIQVDGKQNPPYEHSQIVKKKDAEKPNGEWNKVEVISFNGKCVHIVNGVVVNYGENSSLIGGKILLQSEYAELYYRNIKIREL
ncbi:DUF1080 domain-containing protein [Galbibacter sp. EGI 63066]|uniref:3-keto-disaccharide hydrolase n=1 Tax=Galbibacter sp. EGI 63066 TaxID=2993559 RepID=UPI00224948A8|nr:DUF1080 domain-containing protein [Galbibacter sp. EGI 63066]MCX2679783.1 DUF1080 domain-containing protein [Galbibacter sp. EGI 63066]